MSFKLHGEHLRRTWLTLGVILLVATAASIGVEIWLTDAQPLDQELGVTSFRKAISLALSTTRTALPIVAALVAVPLLTSRLVRELYATKDQKEAHDTLNRLVFGKLGFGPSLLAKEGEIAAGRGTVVERTGGPASLVVYNDTAVVTEQRGRPRRVLGTGFAQLERFEKVWQTIDLRPQRWTYEVFALTKEGIPVSCNVGISFKIDDRPSGSRNPARPRPPSAKAPFPYTGDAVFLAAANKWVRGPNGDDRFMSWSDRVVIGLMQGSLRNILAEYRLDWLIAACQPDQEHPRQEIRKRLKDELEEKAPAVGARILDVELGEIQVKADGKRGKEVSEQLSDIVSRQRIQAWQADLEARALASRVEGEAELLRMDAARIQAQADMVVNLVEHLQSVITSADEAEPYILALRFVESLRWMSYSSYDQEFMPPEAMRTLKRLQAMVGNEDEQPRGAG